MAFDPKFDSNKPSSDRSDVDRMRRSLGVNAPSQNHRRRFAQEGDVPVEVRGRRDADRETAEIMARSEREAREQAERALAAFQATIRNLQTQLAHAEMALTEARDAASRAEHRANTLETTMGELGAAVAKAEEQLAKETAKRRTTEARLGHERHTGDLAAVTARRRMTNGRIE